MGLGCDMGTRRVFTREEDLQIIAHANHPRGWQAMLAAKFGRRSNSVSARYHYYLVREGNIVPSTLPLSLTPASDKGVIDRAWRITLEDDRRIAVTAPSVASALEVINPTLHRLVKSVCC